MIDVILMAGDDNGGPFMRAVLEGIPMNSEDVTDEQVTKWREAALDSYTKAFGYGPQAMIVTIEDVAASTQDDAQPKDAA